MTVKMHQFFRPADAKKISVWKAVLAVLLFAALGLVAGFLLILGSVVGNGIMIPAALVIKLSIASAVFGVVLAGLFPAAAKWGWLDKLVPPSPGLGLSPKKGFSFKDKWLGALPAATLWVIAKTIYWHLKPVELVLDLLTMVPRKIHAWRKGTSGGAKPTSAVVSKPRVSSHGPLELTQEENRERSKFYQDYPYKDERYSYAPPYEDLPAEDQLERVPLISVPVAAQRTLDILQHFSSISSEHTLIVRPPFSIQDNAELTVYDESLTDDMRAVFSQVLSGIVPPETTNADVNTIYEGLRALSAPQ
ncbi:MAG: hypothetical protein DHS20C10_14450 [marine bacterium B5-7]|nr:MAG: hypothetical protein DHS20C10_14450 [marine bacterium B5-7]